MGDSEDTAQNGVTDAQKNIEDLLRNTEMLLGQPELKEGRKNVDIGTQDRKDIEIKTMNYGTFSEKLAEIDEARNKVFEYVQRNMQERDAIEMKGTREEKVSIKESKDVKNLWGAFWYVRGRKEFEKTRELPTTYWIDPVTKVRVSGPGKIKPKLTKEESGQVLRDLTREYIGNLSHVKDTELTALKGSVSQLKEYLIGKTGEYRTSFFDNSRRYNESKQKAEKLEELLDGWNDKIRQTGSDDTGLEDYEAKRDDVELKLQETKNQIADYATQAIHDRLFHKYLKVQTKLIQGANDAVNKYINMIDAYVSKVEVELKIGDSMESLVDCMVMGGKMIQKIEEAEKMITENTNDTARISESIPGILKAYSTSPEKMMNEIERYEGKMADVEKGFEKDLKDKMDMLERIQKER